MIDAWMIWWSLLCAATAINIAAWCYSAWRPDHLDAHLPADVLALRRVLLLLSAVYVIGCAFRSIFPMVDAPRICLHDAWVSRIFVGRSVATIAELCFAAQWALLLRQLGAAADNDFARVMSRILLPMIALAEVFSWHAVLTTNYLLHAAENSLWTVAAVLAIASFVAVRRGVDEKDRRFLTGAIVCGLGYIAFMVTVDVPMYLSRWQADLAAGREYLSLAEGLREVLQRCTVTRDWAAWRQDVPWLTLYFTVAVWISIALAYVPPVRARRQAALGR